MAKLSREHMRAVHSVFQYFALEDQRAYYARTIERSRSAARRTSQLRAGFSLLTGIASAFVGLLVAFYREQCFVGVPPADGDCTTVVTIVNIALVVAVVAPALGSAFTTLNDLYQWDRAIAIYESALENIEVADAQSPDEEMDDEMYEKALRAYAEGALAVKNDETAQWGQLIRPPQQLETFIAQAQTQVARAQSEATGTPSTPTTPDIPGE